MKYSFNGRELDIGARTLSASDGIEVHIEPQVYDLIRYLAENRGRVVDKEELIARVWKGRVVSDATIASRINAARKAVGDDGRTQAVIATYSRKGFRFVADVVVEDAGLGQPAIAVLPFELLSEDGKDGYLARGLADQLAATLGHAAWFDVADTAASFAEVGADRSPEQISRSLGVDYLVLGTLQTTSASVRLALRLVDPEGGRQVWTSTFTGPRSDVFEMQDRMATEVLGEIEPRLRSTELQKSEKRHGNLTAFDHYLRAADALRAMNLPAMKAARAELDKALAAHPDYAAAHGMHAWIGTLLMPQGYRVDPKNEAEHYRAAVTVGSFDCDALSMGGYAFGFFERDLAGGLDYVRRALAINPSAARAHDFAGWLLLYMGQPDEALLHFDRALTLCPLDELAFRMLTGRAFARLFRGEFEESVADGRRAHAAAKDFTVCHRVLAASLAHLGREREARAIVRELLENNPSLSIARYQRETRFEGSSDRQILLGGLKKAGLP